MDLQTINALVEIVLKAGMGGSLLWVLIGGHYRVWVYGRELTQRLEDAEKRVAEARAETEHVRKDLTGQIYWLQDWETKQRATINSALVVGEKLTEALRQANERLPKKTEGS